MNDLEYCRILQIESSTLQMWVEERWIIPGSSSQARSYEDVDLARGRLILDLIESMGVNHAGVDVVCGPKRPMAGADPNPLSWRGNCSVTLAPVALIFKLRTGWSIHVSMLESLCLFQAIEANRNPARCNHAEVCTDDKDIGLREFGSHMSA
jgi:DNA-binding transcriptional MerR regulator